MGRLGPPQALLSAGLLRLAVWACLSPAAAAGDCQLAGGILLREGDTSGFSGHTCTGTSTFEGTSWVCTNSEVVARPYQGNCSGSVPNCVQCGLPGEHGAALCLSTTEVPEDCSQATHSKCVVANQELAEGQQYEHVANECTGESSYDGTAGVCRGGKIEYEPSPGTCSGSTPYCVQCKAAGPGGAQCLSSLEPTDCPGSAVGACLVGDVFHLNGDRIGVIGETCTGDATYTGAQSLCRDGVVVEEPYEGQCSGIVPHCVQCGSPGTRGAALCLSTPEMPPHCSAPVGTCAVGDVIYQDGDSIGHIGTSCTNERGFIGTESFCRNGEIIEEPYNGSCPTDMYCIQCEAPGTWGAALCLPQPDVPSICSEAGSQECVDVHFSGKAIHSTPETCTGPQSYVGTQQFCRHGSVEERSYADACDGFCIQCGMPGLPGAAICVPEPEAPDSCNFTASSEGPLATSSMPQSLDVSHAAVSDCAVPGGAILPDGADLITFPLVCTHGGQRGAFSGMTTTCVNGTLVDKPLTSNCGEAFPYCVQCGAPGTWSSTAALCMADDVPPAFCTFVEANPEIEATVGGSSSAARAGIAVLMVPLAFAVAGVPALLITM